MNVGFDLAFLPLFTDALWPGPFERLRSMMFPAYASAVSSSPALGISRVSAEPEGVKSPVCGDPVPASGTWILPALLALAGEAIQIAITALSAAASASRGSLLPILSLLVGTASNDRPCRDDGEGFRPGLWARVRVPR